MSGERYQDTAVLSEGIRSYLESHPQRMDTLTGIVNWWWEFERYKQTSAAVEQALAQLVEQGVLRTREVGGETLYFLNSFEEGNR